MRILLVILFVPITVLHAQTQADPCPRPHIGSVIAPPPDLYSANGLLQVELSFRTFSDHYGRRRYCYIAADGSESPTLRLQPGDELVLKIRNDLREAGNATSNATAPHATHAMEVRGPCGSGKITASTTNLHFHGLSIPPACHQDEVLSTLIQPSASGFEYRVRIPLDQPPGLYWYHPHPHGFSEGQVLGGASGALIVEGIERAKPAVAGLPERVLVLRDQTIPGASDEDGESSGRQPGKDVSVNFVAVMYPADRPAAMIARPHQREFWRILNAAADTYFDLQIRTGPALQDAHTPLPLELIAMDGVPVENDPVPGRTDILLAPGARAELMVTTPAEGVFAQVVTLSYDTGPGGEFTPTRVLANLFSTRETPATLPHVPERLPTQAHPAIQTNSPAHARERTLYFSEAHRDPADPKSPLSYFITLEGQTPRAFDMRLPPNIVVRQGTTENWIVENRATEAHVFHIHQIHFQVLERDGRPVHEPSWRDTIDIPYWDGKSARYPSVKLRMDFRDPGLAGTILYHCHILEHEDGGMMGAIRVQPN